MHGTPLLWNWCGEGAGRSTTDDDWKQLHNHSTLLMRESRRVFSFNSLKWRVPLLALKCKQEAFNVLFPQKGNASCSYWSKTLLLVFVPFGICEFCDIRFFMYGLRVVGKWHYYSKVQTEMWKDIWREPAEFFLLSVPIQKGKWKSESYILIISISTHLL